MEAFQEFEKIILETIIAILLALLAAAGVESFFQPFRKRLRDRKLRREIRGISPGAADEFADMTVTWRSVEGVEHTVSSISEIQLAFGTLLKSKDRIALMIGKFGMGKTFLSKYLSTLVKLEDGQKILPIYIDATRFGSGHVGKEIVLQINDRLFDFGLPDFGKLCAEPGTAFIIDGLDQMPTADRGGEILSGTLDAIKLLFDKQTSKATVILVVRSEFYETNTKLQELTEEGQFPLIIVRGFTTDEQRKKFLLSVDRNYGSIRLGKLRQLTNGNDQLNELFERPLLVQRFSKIPLEDVRSMVSSGVTLAKVYRLSFKELDADAEESVIRIAGDLYASPNYATPMAANLAERAFAKNDPAIAHLKQSGILFAENQSLHFSHPTFLDYFAAEAILKVINEGIGEEVIGNRIIHYLVSEFVAGLIDEETLKQLLETIANSKDKYVRFNGMDILTEIVDNANREIAKSYIEKKISGLDFTSDKFDTEKLFFGSIAGIYGIAEPPKYVLKQLRRLGAQEFMKRFFYTQDLFSYYGNSEDRCYAEWLDQLNTRKHGYFRVISCVLLAEMGIIRAIPVLTKVAENIEEDRWVRESAEEALRILKSREYN